jgi:hypothetical protein
MKSVGISRVHQLAFLLSGIAIGAAVYLRSASRFKHSNRGNWNRLDRNAPMHDLADGSFPASDPPSSVPAT